MQDGSQTDINLVNHLAYLKSLCSSSVRVPNQVMGSNASMSTVLDYPGVSQIQTKFEEGGGEGKMAGVTRYPCT